MPLLNNPDDKDIEMNVSSEEILNCVALCAGDVPFFVLSSKGKIISASPGTLNFHKATIQGEEFQCRVKGKRWSAVPDLTMFSEKKAIPVSVQFESGETQSYSLHAFPIPEDDPSILLLRFEPSESNTQEGGLLIQDPLSLQGTVHNHGLWTRSVAMKEMFRILEQAAISEVTVLVRGESGVGKEHVARALHDRSGRKDGPFVAVNCAALMPSLLESELFGHVKGAFTGAVRARTGLFEQGNGGTIFLDEIAEMPLELQAKLLRVLQERKITPVGGTQSREVDVRIISATHRSLRQAVSDGQFREDLMYRLRVVPLFIPPLRERQGDIELLLCVFIHQKLAGGQGRFRDIHPDAMRALLDYTWPGNVRELRNVIEYATVVAQGETLTVGDLPPEFRDPESPRSARSLTTTPKVSGSNSDEAQTILETLQRFDGNRQKAADALAMHRTTLWRKIRQFRIDEILS
ncbi:MAG: sigma-54 dependent transcriptional regulator [Planctomycetota bacterium]|nr:sigma-54 dependent transcriptional regulator [Planctomycetota bacterium]